jgi:hypothetical protein
MSYFGQDTPATPSGDFTNIATGISSILTPLAQVGVSIYQTKQLQKLEKAKMKAEAAAQSAMPMFQPPPTVVQSNTGLLIGVLVGGAVLLGLLGFLLTKKPTSGATSVSSGAVTSASEAPARRIKRIKRVSKPKKNR